MKVKYSSSQTLYPVLSSLLVFVHLRRRTFVSSNFYRVYLLNLVFMDEAALTPEEEIISLPDEPYDFEFVNASTPCHGVVSIPWTEKNHVEMAVTQPRANKTVSTLLLALTRRDAAGDFVLIYWLYILQMLEHLRLLKIYTRPELLAMKWADREQVLIASYPSLILTPSLSSISP